MVSHEQRSLIARTFVAVALTAGVLAAASIAGNVPKKFYPDDPLLCEPTPRPVKAVAKREIDDIYDFLWNSFATAARARKYVSEGARPAINVNTLGEVPDSPWYSNRHFRRRMTIEGLKRGPGNSTPPSLQTAWRVIAAKSNGVTPGFVIEDQHKNRYVLKLDLPEEPELTSAADVIGSKIFYALGYNTPENYIVHFRLEQLELPEGVQWRDAAGNKRPLTLSGLEKMFQGQPKGPDGAYRALASRFIEGELAGPFSYEGMRTDDPNDIVPHEDRRELRGLRVFAAWLNHHDTRSINSMDTLVDENGIRFLKHYLMDFGSILGSSGYAANEPWKGHRYYVDIYNKQTALNMVTFGLLMPRWAQAKYPKLRGVGRFDAWSFDPPSWRSDYPNPAFVRMDRGDAFWAARQVAAFTDEEIRALVETGEYSDPRAAEWIAECLIERRDKIAEAWLRGVLALDRFGIVDGELTFEDLGTVGGDVKRRDYSIRWTSHDGGGVVTALPDANGRRVPAFPGSAQYMAATIRSTANKPVDDPVVVYIRRGRTGPEVVGVDR